MFVFHWQVSEVSKTLVGELNARLSDVCVSVYGGHLCPKLPKKFTISFVCSV